MRTLVYADFHLGSDNSEDQAPITAWVKETLETACPERLIFNGDTFELILPVEHDPNLDLQAKEAVLNQILETWFALFEVVQNSGAKELIFIPGEHDYDLFKTPLQIKLREQFKSQAVTIADHHHDQESSSLIIHGHELDYNRIFQVDEEKISCIDGLTRAINHYLTQTSEIEQKVREATRKQEFSYWYGFSGIPQYIDVVENLFGADRHVYEKEVAAAILSPEFQKWLNQQKSILANVLGRIAKTLALSPTILLKSYNLFYKLLGKIVDSRIKAILQQNPYPDAPDYCFQTAVKNLVLGHFHNPKKESYPEGNAFNISSPRIHVDGLNRGKLEIHRDYSYLSVNGPKVEYSSRRESRIIPN